MKQSEQLDLWVKGVSKHNDELKKCCPDYTCCNKGIDMAPLAARIRFRQAYHENDVITMDDMVHMFVGKYLLLQGNNLNTVVGHCEGGVH